LAWVQGDAVLPRCAPHVPNRRTLCNSGFQSLDVTEKKCKNTQQTPLATAIHLLILFGYEASRRLAVVGRLSRQGLASPDPLTYRSGCVIAHIVPLKRDGADPPSNMQWQTHEQA